AEAFLQVIVHAAVFGGYLVEAGLQVAGLHTEQRLVDRRHARRQCGQGGGDTGSGVVVGGQVVFHDGRAVHPGDAQQYGGGPAGAVLARGAMEQRGTVGRSQFVEQCAELTAHTAIADEGAVGFLHHRHGLGGAGEGNVGHVRAGRGAADDVDVLVHRAARQGVRGRGDLAWGAQVVDIGNAEGIQRSQVRRRRGQGIGAIEHARTHRAVIDRGVGRRGTSDIAEVVDTGQARGVEVVGPGGLGGDGQAEGGQGKQDTEQHGVASF
ncbi:hypothetical protein COLO4_00983, partial [Corchorus olitorius]